VEQQLLGDHRQLCVSNQWPCLAAVDGGNFIITIAWHKKRHTNRKIMPIYTGNIHYIKEKEQVKAMPFGQRTIS
jgi:hypothetical protein